MAVRYPIIIEYQGTRRRATKPYEKPDGNTYVSYLDDIGNPMRALASDTKVVGSVEDVERALPMPEPEPVPMPEPERVEPAPVARESQPKAPPRPKKSGSRK